MATQASATPARAGMPASPHVRPYAGHAPAIRRIAMADLGAALRAGWTDFMANPSHLIFIAAIYPLTGLLIAQSSFQAGLIPLLFPILAGVALIGPFVGVGLYEISRRRENGEEPSLKDGLSVFGGREIRSILLLGAVLCAILLAWLYAADQLYTAIIGPLAPASISEFMSDLFGTAQGWQLIVVGHLVGFVFAAATLMISAVSFPLLVDRDAGVDIAIGASIRAVRENPLVMGVWGLIIAGGLMLGSAALLMGLALVLPVLAHASWHLYRRLVVW